MQPGSRLRRTGGRRLRVESRAAAHRHRTRRSRQQRLPERAGQAARPARTTSPARCCSAPTTARSPAATSWRSTASCGDAAPATRSTGRSRTAPCRCLRVASRSSTRAPSGTGCCTRPSSTSTTCTSRSITANRLTRSRSRPSTATRSSRWASRTGPGERREIAHVRSYLDRAADWDFLVSPASYGTEPLRRGLRLSQRGARDRLPAQRRPAQRRTPPSIGPATVRARLGIREDQSVVPVRADLPRRAGEERLHRGHGGLPRRRRARRPTLGPSYVVLVRGHAFNAREHERIGSAGRVIDVTDYPDVAELMLASDAAVLDYSSLRFDYGLTDKPMIFLVPDLEQLPVETPGLRSCRTSRRRPARWCRRTDEVIRRPRRPAAGASGLRRGVREVPDDIPRSRRRPRQRTTRRPGLHPRRPLTAPRALCQPAIRRRERAERRPLGRMPCRRPRH